jgi:hypothetical protein
MIMKKCTNQRNEYCCVTKYHVREIQHSNALLYFYTVAAGISITTQQRGRKGERTTPPQKWNINHLLLFYIAFTQRYLQCTKLISTYKAKKPKKCNIYNIIYKKHTVHALHCTYLKWAILAYYFKTGNKTEYIDCVANPYT